MADGLTHSQHEELIALMGSDKNKLVSSEELVYEWLSIKLPEEVEILKKAAQLASDFQVEAYATIVPGKTTDADVAKFLKAKMAEYGVTDAWHPDQNPNVNSGPDRGHSHATDKIIQPGDVIQTDFGVKLYGIWVSDIQRFAYVLKEGETSAPKDIQTYWENGKAGSRIALAAMKPGVKGLSDNIEAISLVDRYLEHSRFFIFENNGQAIYIISSADLMQRNLDQRIEVGVVIKDIKIQAEIQRIFDFQWRGSIKARSILADMKNTYSKRDLPPFHAQGELYKSYILENKD